MGAGARLRRRRLYAAGDFHNHVVAWPDGVAYAGGHVTVVNGVARKKLAALDAAGGQLLPWDPHPDSSLGVLSMLADGDRLWVGGDFTRIDGIAQAHIARLGLADGTAGGGRRARRPRKPYAGQPRRPAARPRLTGTGRGPG